MNRLLCVTSPNRINRIIQNSFVFLFFFLFFFVIGDKDAFQREWQEKTRSFPRSIGADRHGHHRREQRAIDSELYKNRMTMVT